MSAPERDSAIDRLTGGGGDGPESDRDLVARAQRDPRAFTPLYTRYAAPVYRYCYRRLGDATAAEDATSQVFLKALRALQSYHDDTFRGWLFTIAYHVLADSFRARLRRPDQTLDSIPELIDRAPTPEEAALAGEERHRVRLLLDQLSEDQRRVIELRLAGLSGVEIARVLGRSHGSVRALQFRGASRLRAILSETGEIDTGGTRCR